MRKSSLASALFSRTQQRLLSALLLNSDKPIYTAELASRFGVRSSTLQRDLEKFTKAGILKKFRSGNRIYFQADEECPVFPDLRALLIKTAGLVDVLHEELAPLASKITVAAVYGSIAAGTENSRSDIDLLIVGSAKMIDLVSLLERATEKLRRQINPTLYNPAELAQKARSSHFVKSVLGKPFLFVLGTSSGLETIIGGKTRRGRTDESGRD